MLHNARVAQLHCTQRQRQLAETGRGVENHVNVADFVFSIVKKKENITPKQPCVPRLIRTTEMENRLSIELSNL